MKIGVKEIIKTVLLLAFGFMLAYLILPEIAPAEDQEPDTSKLDSLKGNYEIVLSRLVDLSLEYNLLIAQRDSLLKIKPDEKIIDSISSVQYLGIDANIELWPVLLAKEDTNFKRYIDSCKAAVYFRNKQESVKAPID